MATYVYKLALIERLYPDEAWTKEDDPAVKGGIMTAEVQLYHLAII